MRWRHRHEALAVDSGLPAGYGEAMVLRDVSLRVAPGEVLAVLGKNGMGKSTLLKTIMGFLPPATVRSHILGRDAPRRRRIVSPAAAVAYSPQEQAIFQELTVEENLRLGLPRGARLAAGAEARRRRFSRSWPSAVASSPARSAAASRRC